MRVLITTAHPDDHLVMAGTILKLRDEFGAKIREITFSYGGGSSTPIETREREIKEAAKYLGIEHKFLIPMDKDGNAFETPARISEYKEEYKFGVIKEIRDFKPDFLFTLPPYDYHPAHQITAKATLEAARLAMGGYRKLGKGHRVKIVAYPDSIIMVRNPALFFDITKYFDAKEYIFKEIYKTQYDPKEMELLRGIAIVRARQTNKKKCQICRGL